ncbi:MAG: sporulation protein YqfD [Oscillospiraceae bacterium]
MKKWIGSVMFEAKGDEIGRFLSLCREEGLHICHFKKSDSVCKGILSPKEYKTASAIGKKTGIRLRIQEKSGFSFLFYRYRKRVGLFICGAFSIALLLFLQSFVWAIDVFGNKDITSTHILATAEKFGLKKGLFLPSADLEKIELSMLGELPTLSFLSLNRIGSRVEIELTEEFPKPFIISDDDPCNIVAEKTGKIQSAEVYRGQNMVTLQEVVCEGDLLVSGIAEGVDQKITYHHARAKIMAETTFKKEFSIAMTQEEKIYTFEKQRTRMDLFGKKLPLFLAFPIENPHDSRKEMKPLRIFDIPLPIGIETETISFYEIHPVTFTEEQSLRLIKENVRIFEEEELADTTILSKEIVASQKGNIFTAVVDYKCLEDIALPQKLEIAMDENDWRQP